MAFMGQEKKHVATFEQLSWQDVRATVSKVKKDFAHATDDINPEDDYRIYRVRYPFGAKIVHDGSIYLPNAAGEVVPLAHSSIPKQVQDDLSYRSVPMGLSTHNSSEVFFEMGRRVISLNVFSPGALIGLWEGLDLHPSYLAKRIWAVNAGARSIVLALPFSDAGQHSVLQRDFGSPDTLPKSPFDHHKTVVAIANSPNFEQEWYCEILYFSKPFIDNNRDDHAWKDYQLFLYREGWEQTYYWRNKVTYDLIWQMLILKLESEDQKIKYDPYDFHIAKHLGLVGTGVLPGLKAATDNSCAPIDGLQDVVVNKYGQKLYFPTFVVPHQLKPNELSKIYYPMQFPMILESPLKRRKSPTLITTLREIKKITKKFKEEALAGNLMVEGTPIMDFVENIDIDYFHSELDTYGGVRLSSELPKEDPALISYPDETGKMQFADNSPFSRGCIRLSRKKTNK
jgi:hypothetical protein